MNATELRASLGLSGIYALRMLGMFLILPVFALYAQTLDGAQNHTLIGIALGSYGLTQALLQLPLGMLSDKIGRKKVIYGGLLLFALGSFVAAGAHDIATLTVGRVIQGAGAISAAITALLADLTREENRTKAMAMIGMSIGTTFAASLVLGPLLAKYIGVNGIFALTGALSLAALIGVWLIIPTRSVPVSTPTPRPMPSGAGGAERPPAAAAQLRHLRLARGPDGDVRHHPLRADQDRPPGQDPALAGVSAGDGDRLPADGAGHHLRREKARLKQVFVGAIALMAAAQLGMAMALDSFWQIVSWLGLYFIAFNILEATLPSLISKIAPADAKGTAIGVYNTAQSLGLFLGAALGGWLYTRFGPTGVFGFTSLLMLSWLLWSLAMRPPMPVRSVMFHIGEDWRGDAGDLSRNWPPWPACMKPWWCWQTASPTSRYPNSNGTKRRCKA